MDTVYMGYAQEDISPCKAVRLVGYDGRANNISKGILHSLIVQITVWKKAEEIFCLIAVDSLGFTVKLTDILRGRVAEVLDTGRDKVMVCFSHTHSAPNAAAEKEYYAFLCEKIISAVKRAEEVMIPVTVGWGIGDNNVGVNRRLAGGPVDGRLGILKICGAESGRLEALILRVTAHCNVLTADNYMISPDYFGTARDLLESKYGCRVIMIQGASGNVRPRFRQENADFLEIHPAEAAKGKISPALQKKYFVQSQESLDKMAEAVYLSVKKVIDGIRVGAVVNLSVFSVSYPFYAAVPSAERARSIAEEAFKEAAVDGTGWLAEVKRLSEEKIKRQSSDIEIQFFIVGAGCFCGVSCEAMSEIAVNMWKKTADPLVFFNGYTNGCGSYLPTAEEYDKGGYEVLWSNLLYYRYHGRVMPFNRDTAEKLENNIAGRWKNISAARKFLK